MSARSRQCRLCPAKIEAANQSGLCIVCLKTHKSQESTSGTPDTTELTRYSQTEVLTLEDLIRVCQIDLNVWEVERWVANKWAMGSKHPETGEITVTPLFQVKAWLRRLQPQVTALIRLREELVASIRKHTKPVKPKRYRFVDGGYLLEYTPFDLHIGKHTWGDETVTHYDTDIAVDLFKASQDYLLRQALKCTDGKLERILCVFGNDVSHIDNKRAQTTAGTQMDVDSRFAKVYWRIVQSHREAVDRFLEVAPVDIVIVPGNHDELTAFHLGIVLKVLYENHPHVTVDNNPRPRKYYEFGSNLLGFAHGHSERVDELPLTMAREMPDAWARCSSREWHIGHKHIAEEKLWRAQELFSDKGVRVRRLSSMSAHDYWHTVHAYMDRRACDSFIFHKEAGFTNHLSFNVDHFTGEALSK